jgi:hypothetical protein
VVIYVHAIYIEIKYNDIVTSKVVYGYVHAIYIKIEFIVTLKLNYMRDEMIKKMKFTLNWTYNDIEFKLYAIYVKMMKKMK